MPNRLLRAEILDSDRVDALSAEAEVFYRRLMSVVDDFGRFHADWRVLRSNLFPLRAEQIAKEQIENWLRECTQIIDGEDEPLVTLYQDGRKKLLELNNFGQRLRSKKSKFPAPPEREKKKNPLTIVNTCQTSAAHASTPSLSPTPPPTTPPTTPPSPSPHPAAAARNGTTANGTDVEYQQHFDKLAAEYPAEGLDRTKRTFETFAAVMRTQCNRRGITPIQLLHELLEAVQRYREKDFRWQSGRVHSLKTFLVDELWREAPQPVATAERARSPSKAAARKALLESVSL